MKIRVAAVGVALFLTTACSAVRDTDRDSETELGANGALRLKLETTENAAVAIVIQNVFDTSQAFLVDCMWKTGVGDAGSFCDELVVLPPGAYEVIVQSQDPNCRTAQSHYKIIVKAGETVEFPIDLVCAGRSGGLDLLVSVHNQPTIDDIDFWFSNGARGNKFMCQCGDPMTVSVLVTDPDNSCGELAPATWSAVNSANQPVTTLLFDPEMTPADGGCSFSTDVNPNVPLDTYFVTFSVSDGETEAASITFPLHLADCNGHNICGLQCVDLGSDELNCGACGTVCPNGNLCVAGVCTPQGCPPGYTSCGGTCVDLQSSSTDCGACGNACSVGQLCVSGLCTTSCPAGQSACNGTCVDLFTDVTNCGSCGNVCPSGQACVSGVCESDCVPGYIDGVNLDGLTNYLFVFTDAQLDANWQASTNGYVGDVAVDGVQADERTSGTVPYAGTISTSAPTLGAWEDIVDAPINTGQAFASYSQVTKIASLETSLNDAFTQINGLTVTSGYAGVSATSLNGLDTQDGIAQTLVINVTSGFSVSSKIYITGDAEDVFILRWDSDQNFANGYQGQVKFQSGGAIVPQGGLTAASFIHVAGDLGASGGGWNPAPPYPQGPRYDDGQGSLINGGSDFSGGGFFTGYWLTTGAPSLSSPTAGPTSSLSNAIFVGGWYSRTTRFSMTSGTSGVYVAPACPPTP